MKEYTLADKYSEFATISADNENICAVEKRATYKELTGYTWNTLCGVMAVLRQICEHLEGDASTLKNEAEFKCFRDVLVANRNKAEDILNVVNQIADVIGVS